MNLRHFRIFDSDTKQQLGRIQHAGYLKCTDSRACTLGLRDHVSGANFGTSNKPNLVHSALVPMLLAACMRFRALSRAVLRYQAAIKGQQHDERDFYSGSATHAIVLHHSFRPLSLCSTPPRGPWVTAPLGTIHDADSDLSLTTALWGRYGRCRAHAEPELELPSLTKVRSLPRPIKSPISHT